ncbi:MAG: threonine/serine dehydratase [Rhodospirillales bacterium]|nr:threonine/serine dehydratase [Rhodospirillales bacterium]
MPTSPAPKPPTYADVADAAKRIATHVVTTPLLESPLLNERVGGRLLVKAEPLQRTGSFKFRGAFNRLSRLDDTARRLGVVAFSSGNHAQGVAAAAGMLGIPATIVMPRDAPAIKIANTHAYGAEVVLYDRGRESREDIANRLTKERGATLVPSYDDRYVIAGQGTVGLEIARQARDAKAVLDAVIVPCGGGGLISGCALALAEACPGVAIYSAEPKGFDDTMRSLAAGKRVANNPDARTICDALMLPTPGEMTFAINKRLLKGGLAVSDDDARRAMKAAFRYLKLVVEPGGAVALAAALTGGYDCRGKTAAVVCSGGNVDADTFTAALSIKDD